jgi:hypothetical protein
MLIVAQDHQWSMTLTPDPLRGKPVKDRPEQAMPKRFGVSDNSPSA